MSNPSTGLWSALGALAGGAAGAYAAKYVAQARPRFQYASAPGASPPPTRRRPPAGSGESIEDAMIVGGALGAMVGAFVGGTAAGEPAPAAQTAALPAAPKTAGVGDEAGWFL